MWDTVSVDRAAVGRMRPSVKPPFQYVRLFLQLDDRHPSFAIPNPVSRIDPSSLISQSSAQNTHRIDGNSLGSPATSTRPQSPPAEAGAGFASRSQGEIS